MKTSEKDVNYMNKLWWECIHLCSDLNCHRRRHFTLSARHNINQNSRRRDLFFVKISYNIIRKSQLGAGWREITADFMETHKYTPRKRETFKYPVYPPSVIWRGALCS